MEEHVAVDVAQVDVVGDLGVDVGVVGGTASNHDARRPRLGVTPESTQNCLVNLIRKRFHQLLFSCSSFLVK